MVSELMNIWLSFLAGLYTPLGAVCVLPLYPGFLAYLASKVSKDDSKKTIVLFGFIVMSGVLVSMFLVGLLFTAILKTPLTKAIGVLSPIAFVVLALVSLLLIFNVDIGRFMPKMHAPVLQNPFLSSFVFGLFFGAIVLPCNPASLAVLFAVSTSTLSFLTNFVNFLFFGVGMGLPLLVLAIISAAKSQQVIRFLTRYQRVINIIAGIIMLGISLYYLIFVFRVVG